MGNIILSMIRAYRRFTSDKYGWRGNYTNWEKAKQQCTGYDAAAIIEKVRAATLKVKNGEAVYERDSMLFDKKEYSWPLLANLLWIAAGNNSKLTVLDFGGSLGTSYFQNKEYLQYIKPLQWCVTEQKQFVDIGQQEIADDTLKFYTTVDEVINEQGMPDVLLISCVLPYLEKPYELLKEMADKKFPYILIENTYFNSKPGDRLTIQKVPPIYYEASYPAWFLDYHKVIATLTDHYEIAEEYVNDQFLYFYGEKINYQGALMRRK